MNPADGKPYGRSRLREATVATRYRAIVVGLSVAAWFFIADGNIPVAEAAPGEQPVTVLDTKSVWHTYTALKPPVATLDGAMKYLDQLEELGA